MIIATVPWLFCLAGLLTYVLSTNAKVAEVGRIAFAFGLLVALLALQHSGAVRVLP